jgi:drug/metabolite transporter (DMT)-like permease
MSLTKWINSNVSLGMRYMVLSAFGFSLMAVCVKLASGQDIPVLEIVAARALVSLVLSYIDVKRKGISLLGHKKHLLLSRGMVGALALMCVYYAITRLPLAEATVLQYLHPMFTAVLALMFLKERIQTSTMLSILFSFIGLLLVARPEFLFGVSQSNFPLLAIGAAVLGAFGSAVAYVFVRKLNETEDASVIIFYFPMVALPISLGLLGADFVMPTGWTWLTLLFVGVFTQIGQIGLTKAMKTETASKATAFSYLQVVFAVLLGWALFGEVPDVWVILGGGFILFGAILNVFMKR